MPTDRERMAWQAATLYRLDAAGRILEVNEGARLGDGAPGPRLFIGRTLAGDQWWVRHDLPPALSATLAALLANEPPPTDLRQLPACLPAVVAALTAAGGAPGRWHGPAWTFPATLPPSTPDTLLVTADQSAVLLPHFADLIPELPLRQPVLALVRDAAAVAVCFSSRNTAHAAEAGLETAPAHRGRGFGTQVTAAWATAVRAEGRTPLYSTSWDNLASQAVARKLGLRLYGADLSLS